MPISNFYRRGGYLIANYNAHIGFKAIGKDGKGLDVSGIITGRDQKQVAEFRSGRYGIGSFDLPVQNGESYLAKVTLPGGLIKEYPLPVVKPSGTGISIRNSLQSDSLEIAVFATNDVSVSGNSYFLVGTARGVVCYAAILNFNNGGLIKRKVAKSLFPSGIARFTVMTADKRPVNGRAIYVEGQDRFKIQLKTDRPDYAPFDSVAVNIKVTDKQGKPCLGNFSLSVTDDALVFNDTLNNKNILSQTLLASELNGYVDHPGYYLLNKTPESRKALDDLLLTQGWTGYDWKQIFNPPPTLYRPVFTFAVSGHVLNLFNKPVKNTNVLLFSKRPEILSDTLTNSEGRFVFDHFPRIDTPIFVLKAVNKNGKSFNVNISVDEEKTPEFKDIGSPPLMPWYVNSDTTLINYTRNNTLLQQQDYTSVGRRLLKEVKIVAKKIVKGSQNLNGAGGLIW